MNRTNTLRLAAIVALAVLSLVSAWTCGGTSNAALPNGLALSLDGNDDYAAAPDSPSLDLGVMDDDFTVETFFYVPDLNEQATDTMIWKQGSYGVYIIYNTASEDRLIFRLYTGFNTYNFIYGDENVTVGWHHIAGVFDNENTPDADLIALYLDGEMISSSDSAFEWTPGIPNTTSALNLGSYLGVNPTKGWLDETRFSNSVRYSGNSYTVPTEPFTSDASTRALWHFDEGSGSASFADSSATETR